MAKERTEHCNYPSKYSPKGWVSAAQYLTECICEKKARCDGKDLPTKFWELDEWNKFYRQQIVAANNLLKEFQAEAIINALKQPQTSKTYSLRAPFLRRIIESEQGKLKIVPIQTEIIHGDILAKPKPAFNKGCGLRDL